MSNRTQLAAIAICCFSGGLLNVATGPAGAGAASAPTSRPAARYNIGDPYCGIYCVYATLRFYGRNVDMRSLIRPGFISSGRGSTLSDLASAASTHGLETAAMKNMSLGVLRRAQSPVVLHVSDQSDKYDHFVLFLGTSRGKAVLLDPMEGTTHWEWAKLTRKWDGNALIVSDRPVPVADMLAPSYIFWALSATGLGAVFWAARRWQNRNITPADSLCRLARAKRSITQCVGLSLAATVTAIAYHGLAETGFLRHSEATANVVEERLMNFVEKVDADDIRSLREGGAIFVDARFPGDFEVGHLEGAVNIPPFYGQRHRAAALQDVSRNATLVVYCQSAGCNYADRVTARLIKDGYDNVMLYRGGWTDWANNREGNK